MRLGHPLVGIGLQNLGERLACAGAFATVGVLREVGVGEGDDAAGGDLDPVVDGVRVKACNGTGRGVGAGGFAQGAVEDWIFRQDLAALVGRGAACEANALPGLAVRFLSADDVGVGQLVGLDD